MRTSRKSKKSLIFFENNENHENLEISNENHDKSWTHIEFHKENQENNENLRILQENFENQ